MTCPKCKKQFEIPIIKGNGNFRSHPFVGEVEDNSEYCPHCRIPINAYIQAQRMKKIRKTFHRPTKVVDKDKNKKTRAQRKKEFKKEIE